jgi:hypothetical protein
MSRIDNWPNTGREIRKENILKVIILQIKPILMDEFFDPKISTTPNICELFPRFDQQECPCWIASQRNKLHQRAEKLPQGLTIRIHPPRYPRQSCCEKKGSGSGRLRNGIHRTGLSLL